MHNKRVQRTVVSIIIAGVLTLFFYGTYSSKMHFYDSLATIDKSQIIDYQDSPIKDVLKITMEEPRVVYNATTPEKTKDDEMCNIMYDIRIKNISKDPIKFNVQIFVPYVLYESIILDEWIGSSTSTPKTLKPGEGFRCHGGILMLHPKLLSTKQRILFAQYKNQIDLQIYLNGEYYLLHYNRKD